METDFAVKTPVLFIVFNQPEITRKVFQAIRAVKPKRLFVSADAPRAGNKKDAVDCAEVRKIVTEVDWDCELVTRFHETNQGCKIGVSGAITWFLDQVGEGIILEYDCLPNPEFFQFCELMLDRYRNDLKVFAIAGTNNQLGQIRGDGSYYFSHIPTAWGWATWKRAWDFWDPTLPGYQSFVDQRVIERLFRTRSAQKFWLEKFRDIYTGENKTTWGFSWVYALMSRGGLSVIPNKNLISNIGFSPTATHATNTKDIYANLRLEPFPDFQKEPTDKRANLEADEFFTSKLSQEPLNHKITKTLRRMLKPYLPEFVRPISKKILKKAKMY